MPTTVDKPTAPEGTMKGALTPDMIEAILGKSRSRNVYGPKLLEFVNESDEAGINPREAWPTEFKSKQASTMYQGFMKAVNEADLTETVLIKQSDGEVFILHKQRMALLLNTPVVTDEA